MGAGTSSPSQKLEVNGNIKLSGSGRQIYFNNDGAGLYWGQGYSRIVDNGNLRICTDDVLGFNTGSTSSSLGTERMRLDSSGLGVDGNIDGYGMTSGDTLWTKDGKVYADTPRYSVVDYRYEKIIQGMGRSVTSSRFTGMVVWTPVNNDDAAAVFFVAENSNSGNGSVVRMVHQTDYYLSLIHI